MDMGVTVDGVGVELLLMKLISKYIDFLVLCWDSYRGVNVGHNWKPFCAA